MKQEKIKMEDYLKPYMSREDFDFLVYMVRLQEDFENKLVETDGEAKPPADLLDPEKTERWRKLGMLKTSIMSARFREKLQNPE